MEQRPDGLRGWAPVAFVAVVLAALIVGGVAGVRMLTAADTREEPTPDSERLVVQEYEPIGPRVINQKIDGVVLLPSGERAKKPYGKVLTTIDGRYNIDISAYTDGAIAAHLVTHAMHILHPESLSYAPMREGGNRWWHEVVTTSEAEGGPRLNDPNRLAEILDGRNEGDYGDIEAELEWLRTPVGG